MKFSILILVATIGLNPFEILATEQCQDKIIYKADTILINGNPLGDLLRKDFLINKKILRCDSISGVTPSCEREYIATWKILNDSLFLIDLISSCDNYTYDLDWVFGSDKVKNDKVFADWFTGNLMEYINHSDFFSGNYEKNKERFNYKIINGTSHKLKVRNECEKASIHALNDFNNSKYSFHYSSYYHHYENTYTLNILMYVLVEYYEIELHFTDSLNYYSCYDTIMVNELKSKYGSEFLGVVKVLVDSLVQADTWILENQYIGGQNELDKYILSKLELDLADLKTSVKTELMLKLKIDSTGKAIKPKIHHVSGKRINKTIKKKITEIINQMPKWKQEHLYNAVYYKTINIDI